MCGRYTLTATGEELARAFEAEAAPDIAPRYNVAPTQSMPIVVAGRRPPEAAPGERGVRRIGLARWGLVPSWAEDPAIGNRLINARAESAAGRPAWRRPFRTRRCLVPATGFFEWKQTGRAREPWLLRPRGGGLFAFAGLWDRWKAPDGSEWVTYAIVTGRPNGVAGAIHDRMPVILPPEHWSLWLDREMQDPTALKPLLVPSPDEEMEAVPVGRAVNDVRNDDPGCVEPLGDETSPGGAEGEEEG